MWSEEICGDGCGMVMIVTMGGTSAFILSELINIPITLMTKDWHLECKMQLLNWQW